MLKATTTRHKSTQWTSFFQFSRERFISYWLKYLIDHQSDLDNLEAEEDNIKSAWINAAKQQQVAELSQAMEPLYQFYRTRGRIKEGQLLFGNTLLYYTNGSENYSDLSPAQQKLIGRLLTFQAWFCRNVSQYDLAEKLIQQASPLLYKLNDTKYIAFLLSTKGSIQRYSYGNLQQAKGMHYRAFNLYQALNDQWGIANSLNNLGALNVDLGDYQIATQLLEKATTICYQNNYHELLAQSISNLGVAYEGLGQFSKAIETYQACYEVCQQIQNKLGMAISLANQGQIALRQEQFTNAKNLSIEQLVISREIDNKHLQVGGLADLGNAYYMLERYDLAWETLQKGFEIATSIKSQPATIQVVAQIAHLFYHLGMPKRSFAFLTNIQSTPFSNRHLGNPENLYDILVAELPANITSAIQHEWQDKTLHDVVSSIQTMGRMTLNEIKVTSNQFSEIRPFPSPS